MALENTNRIQVKQVESVSRLQVKLDRSGGLQPISKITLPAISGGAANRLDLLSDVMEPENATNNSTLVYNSQTDKYEVKLLDLDGGSF